VEERRRVSFPDNERDYLGEADWDYDRTPIEVDFDSCFSKYVARVLSVRRRSALRAELWPACPPPAHSRRSQGKKKRQQFFDRILSPINILIFLVLYIISLAYMILKVMRYI
jgi:hypothetical protein